MGPVVRGSVMRRPAQQGCCCAVLSKPVSSAVGKHSLQPVVVANKEEASV